MDIYLNLCPQEATREFLNKGQARDFLMIGKELARIAILVKEKDK